MDDTLLNLLVCPYSKNKLYLAEKEIIDKANKLVSEKKCRNINGDNIEDSIIAGLYEPKNNLLYLIKDEIPILIYEQAVKIK